MFGFATGVASVYGTPIDLSERLDRALDINPIPLCFAIDFNLSWADITPLDVMVHLLLLWLLLWYVNLFQNAFLCTAFRVLNGHRYRAVMAASVVTVTAAAAKDGAGVVAVVGRAALIFLLQVIGYGYGSRFQAIVYGSRSSPVWTASVFRGRECVRTTPRSLALTQANGS